MFLTRHHTKDKATSDLFVMLVSDKFNKDRMLALLQNGADPTVTDNYSYDNTLINWLIGNSYTKDFRDVLSTLYEFYLPTAPQIFDNLLNRRDDHGKSPLFFACVKGWQHYPDTKKDYPPMFEAIRTLVEANADINLCDDEGNTPLHMVIMRRDFEAIEYLISHGASLMIQNNDGLTPAQMLQYTYEEAIDQVSKRSVVYTMQEKKSFYEVYPRIRDLLIEYCPAQDRAGMFGFQNAIDGDPAINRMKISSMMEKLHSMFKSKKYATVSEDDVYDIISSEGASLPIDPIEVNQLVTTVNRENKMATICGYSNRYWDCLYQFVARLFGKDRVSVINKTCANYTKLMYSAFDFNPMFSQQRNKKRDLLCEELQRERAPQASRLV